MGIALIIILNPLPGTHDLVTEDGTISASPNPSTGKFTLTSQSSINEIEVFNLLGERVFAAKYANGLTLH
jgi:hypothetical protein